MRIMTWDIEKGGREKIQEILDVIKKEDSDVLVLTGFRLNHNKYKVIKGLKQIGYPFYIYNKKENKYRDTVLIASKEKLHIEKYNSNKKDSFLIVKKDDVYIAGMNFTSNKSQRDLVNLFESELSRYKDKNLIVAGNMQTAQNYATPNSLGNKSCKKYLDFNDMGFNNCIVECGYANNEYTWKARKDCEYNVDFILSNKSIDITGSYCYYNSKVKNEGISSHCAIILNLIIK